MKVWQIQLNHSKCFMGRGQYGVSEILYFVKVRQSFDQSIKRSPDLLKCGSSVSLFHNFIPENWNVHFPKSVFTFIILLWVICLHSLITSYIIFIVGRDAAHPNSTLCGPSNLEHSMRFGNWNAVTWYNKLSDGTRTGSNAHAQSQHVKVYVVTETGKGHMKKHH